MENHEYYKIYISLIPQEVIDEYNLMDKQINGFLYVSMEKGMYRIFQDISDHSDMSLRQSLQDCGATIKVE